MTVVNADLRAKLDEVNTQIGEVDTDLKTKYHAWEQAREEFTKAGNDANRTDSDEFKKVEAVHKEYAQVAERKSDLDAVRDGLFRMLGVDAPQEGKTDPTSEPTPPQKQGEQKTLGQRAAESDGYKRLVESGALGSDRRSFNAELAEMGREELKALIVGAGTTSGGAFVNPDIIGYVPQPQRPLTVVDLITTGQTDSDSVQYVRQSAFTNVAAETAEATATTTGTKPEATIDFSIITEAVKTIAHWIPATRRALADAGQMRTLIDGMLRYGLNLRLEDEIVNGNGTGENLTGILNTSNILSQAKGSDSVADAIHKAITQIRLGYVEPNGVALHPNDWQILRLSRDDSGASAGTGQYLYGPPAMAGAQQVWGLPVAVTPAVPDDTGLVGDFRYATLWLREGAQVLATDSHSDFFVKNLVAILAEMRAAFGVQLPAAFCKVTSLD
jgi:HK97 family phage major capsid protein